MPKVTVIIPTYNRPDLLPKAIKSVLAQTWQDFEVVVVDDGQEKSSETVVRTFDDERIRYVKHTEQKGCSAAKNIGIKQARGEYIAFLDDDDTFRPEKIELQVKALKNTPDDIGFCFTGSLEIYDNREYQKTVPEGLADYLELALRNFSTMIDSSMLYKRSVFDEVGLLDETFPTHTGAEFIIRVTKKYKGVGINKPLITRLMTSEHVQMGSSIQRRITGRIMLLKRYEEDFAKHPAFLAKHVERLAKFYRSLGDYRNARKQFWHSITLEPRLGRALHYFSMTLNGLGYRLIKFVKAGN